MEQSVEENSPTPHASELEYVSGEWLLQTQLENNLGVQLQSECELGFSEYSVHTITVFVLISPI